MGNLILQLLIDQERNLSCQEEAHLGLSRAQKLEIFSPSHQAAKGQAGVQCARVAKGVLVLLFHSLRSVVSPDGGVGSGVAGESP